MQHSLITEIKTIILGTSSITENLIQVPELLSELKIKLGFSEENPWGLNEEQEPLDGEMKIKISDMNGGKTGLYEDLFEDTSPDSGHIFQHLWIPQGRIIQILKDHAEELSRNVKRETHNLFPVRLNDGTYLILMFETFINNGPTFLWVHPLDWENSFSGKPRRIFCSFKGEFRLFQRCQ